MDAATDRFLILGRVVFERLLREENGLSTAKFSYCSSQPPEGLLPVRRPWKQGEAQRQRALPAYKQNMKKRRTS